MTMKSDTWALRGKACEEGVEKEKFTCVKSRAVWWRSSAKARRSPTTSRHSASRRLCSVAKYSLNAVSSFCQSISRFSNCCVACRQAWVNCATSLLKPFVNRHLLYHRYYCTHTHALFQNICHKFTSAMYMNVSFQSFHLGAENKWDVALVRWLVSTHLLKSI